MNRTPPSALWVTLAWTGIGYGTAEALWLGLLHGFSPLDFQVMATLPAAVLTHVAMLGITSLPLRLLTPRSLPWAWAWGGYPSLWVLVAVNRNLFPHISILSPLPLLLSALILAGSAGGCSLLLALWNSRFPVPLRNQVAIAAKLLILLAFLGVLGGGRAKAILLGPSGMVAPGGNKASFQGAKLLLVVIDTWRADSLGAGGHPEIHTPSLDRLAREGLQFPSTFAEMPLTAPGFLTLLTGKPAWQHGVQSNGVPYRSEEPLLPENTGLFSAAVVSGFPLYDSVLKIGERFDLYYDTVSWSPFLPDEFRDLLWYRIIERLGVAPLPPLRERSADDTARVFIKWLKHYGALDWLAVVHFYDPHTPYEPPWPWNALSVAPDPHRSRMTYRPQFEPVRPEDMPSAEIARIRELYRAEIESVDKAIGHIFRQLEALDLLRSTVICVTSDHGESLGEHDYFFNHGRSLTEDQVRVPCLWQVPPENRKPADSGLNPGLYSLEWVMNDLLAIHHRRAPSWRTFIPVAPLSLETSPQAVYSKEGRWFGMRGKGWKLLLPEQGKPEWFDLAHDPGETVPQPVPPSYWADLDRLEHERTQVLSAAPNLKVLDRETREQLKGLGYLQ